MTWAELQKSLMARFDALELRFDVLEERAGEMAERIEDVRSQVNDLSADIGTLEREVAKHGFADDALRMLDELAEDARRRELNGMRDELRARRAS